VRGVDLKYPQFSDTAADEFIIGDLRDQSFVGHVLDQYFGEIYQPDADMGGAAGPAISSPGIMTPN
jgi:GDP-D-mannose 3', 5'-epimerase